jgi:hypothetical protein
MLERACEQIATKLGVSPTTVSRCSRQLRPRRSERRARLEARTNQMEPEMLPIYQVLEPSNFNRRPHGQLFYHAAWQLARIGVIDGRPPSED